MTWEDQRESVSQFTSKNVPLQSHTFEDLEQRVDEYSYYMIKVYCVYQLT